MVLELQLPMHCNGGIWEIFNDQHQHKKKHIQLVKKDANLKHILVGNVYIFFQLTFSDIKSV